MTPSPTSDRGEGGGSLGGRRSPSSAAPPPATDIELNPLGQTRSFPEGSSSFTFRGSFAGTGNGQNTFHTSSLPKVEGSTATEKQPGLKGATRRFIDTFRREDGTSAYYQQHQYPITHGYGPSYMGDDFNPYTDDPVSPGGGRRPSAITDILPNDNRPSLNHEQQSRYYDLRTANRQTASSLLARELKGRHLQMIAIGGSIGTGLFVASGKALSEGGPASVLLAYLFVGTMLYCTVQALGELAVIFPVAGSFSAFSTRFLDPSWGFAMGWNYALQWVVVLPLEIIAGAMTIEYWNPGLNKSGFVTLFLFVIVLINLFGVKGYGEAEFVFAIIKVTAVIGFILLGIVINIGGTPDEGYIGGKYWSDPGAFNNGFKGLCSVFVTAAFAFAGTELVGLAAAETQNPRKSLPTAIKQVFWRISLFYIVSLTLVGLLVPYNEPRLMGATNIADASASPFVIAIESAGTTVLPSIMNGVILISVISVGNSSVFGSSRTLAALAEQGQAPKILAYVDRKGRPLVAILVASAVGLLAYMSGVKSQQVIFDWLLAISGLSSIFTWASTCLAHIRLRQAWAYNNRSLSDIAFRAQAGVIGSWVGFICNVLILIAQVWIALDPVKMPGKDGSDPPPMTSRQLTENFFLQCLALPVVVVFAVGHKLWYRTSVVRVDEMDIDTGRRDFGRLGIIKAQEDEERATWPRWKRAYRYVC